MSEEQPMPTPRREDVYPVARDAFTDMLDGRTRIGRDRYGEPLQTHNGRNAFQDAMEEAVDLWQYLIQARLEHDDLKQELLAEQHINRRLTRTVIEVQGERDVLRARAESAERDGLAAVEEVRRLVRSITEGNICRLCEMIYGHHDPTCPVIHAATEPPAPPAAADARDWKAWAEVVEELLVHRLVVHDIDPSCPDCQTIIAIIDSEESPAPGCIPIQKPSAAGQGE